MKVCSKCMSSKQEREFSGYVKAKDGLQDRCKACCNAYARERSRCFALRAVVDVPDSKRCPKCHLRKSNGDFRRNKTSKDGMSSTCRACDNARDSAYHAKNRTALNAKSKAYYESHKEQHSILCKAWREAHKEFCTSYNKAYYIANRDKILARSNAAYQNYSESIKAKRRTYRKVARDRVATAESKIRAKRARATGSHTATDIAALLKSQRGKCVVCRTSIIGCYHVDHIVALARGGSNDKSNIQLLCECCNKRKHAKDPIVFMQQHGYLL